MGHDLGNVDVPYLGYMAFGTGHPDLRFKAFILSAPKLVAMYATLINSS
jgi:hypothetical protein